ncbi:MAG: DNA-protecting protein DprA [Deltaproteobacteria bacterium]|nr:DNA-protecting protein DprA [Deltaproteobacteria bacterium]
MPNSTAAGLAPGEARAWLALQRAFAFLPEKVAPALRAGRSPESLLAEADVEVPPESGPLDALVERHARLGARLIPLPDPAYPESLRALDDAPLVLTVRGRPEGLCDPAIAIVGSRAASLAARRFAHDLARDLAREGIAIVSGLARGVDAEAHRGALEAGGVTIGVLACGVDRIYPPEHRSLAVEMMRSGAVLSELPLDTLPRPLHFPLRNRIISGLVRAVVVVEARRRSGSLITVRHALNQGREVFAVPGPVDGPFAAGTNQLLREGARVIQSARDLLEDLGIAGVRRGARVPKRSLAEREVAESGHAPKADRVVRRRAATLESQLLEQLASGPRTADELLAEAGIEPGRLATALLELELAGRIAQERDGRIHLCRLGEDRAPMHPSLRCAPPEPEEIPP